MVSYQQVPNNNININADNDYAFSRQRERGRIEVAKWLLSVPNNNININADNDSCFQAISVTQIIIEVVKMASGQFLEII